MSFNLTSECTNNQAEYEALATGAWGKRFYCHWKFSTGISTINKGV